MARPDGEINEGLRLILLGADARVAAADIVSRNPEQRCDR
jgi:hypothetical protein